MSNPTFRKVAEIGKPLELISPDGWSSVYRPVTLECGHTLDYTGSVKMGDMSLECYFCPKAVGVPCIA
jgi:hypothetical protein